MSSQDHFRSLRRKVYVACGLLLVVIVLAYMGMESGNDGGNKPQPTSSASTP